jgi:hypothetical protein
MAEIRNPSLSVSQSLRARLHPLGNGRYSVLFDGKLLVEGSRDPECGAARALLARGSGQHRHGSAASDSRDRQLSVCNKLFPDEDFDS